MTGQLDLGQLSIRRTAGIPLATQVYEAIERQIAGGTLPYNSRLPTTRELAAALGVNRGTVQTAYRRLAESGLVAGRVGSGTVVVGSLADRPEESFRLEELVSRKAAGVPDEEPIAITPPLIADFSRLAPDERFFPLEEFTKILAEAWSRRSDLWQYAPPLGLEDLRTEIARRLAEHGIQRGPDEILVTSGAQQGLDLLFRTFTDPGDPVAMESPTYSGALALARFAGVRIVELPVGLDGANPTPLFGARPKLVYLMPERQNPTGVTAGNERRDEIVRAVEASGALLVEDGYEEPESGIAPLAVRIPEQTVWLGTLSKDLVPGFRIGWIAGARGIVETLARVKKTADFQTPLPLQAAVAAFLREGADRRARRARAFDVEAKRISTARILRHLLPEISWMGGEIGNPLFWINLPRGVSGRRVAEAAAARGVGVAPGSDFDPRGEDRPNVRLSVSRVDKRDVEKGIRLFAEAVHAVTGSSGIHAMPVV